MFYIQLLLSPQTSDFESQAFQTYFVLCIISHRQRFNYGSSLDRGL